MLLASEWQWLGGSVWYR
jgi:hypothetical protein